MVLPGGGVEGTPGGVLSTVKRGVDRTPNPKRTVIREERESARERLPEWLDPELWKRFMGKAHNCPRINDRSLAYGFLWGWA